MSCGCGTSIFGPDSQYIKFQNGDIIAIEGANTVERLLTGDLRIPYAQILKGRIVLKAGQINYFFNFLGLGDNATFLAIKATYNTGSVSSVGGGSSCGSTSGSLEEDNYILWNYYDDFSKKYPMAQMMILTGNSTNRIKQLYLSNPNPNYPVTLDVMVGSMDDTYNYFPDVVNQSATTFVNLNYSNIASYVVGQSIQIQDVNSNPLLYMQIPNINYVSRVSNIVTIDDNTIGQVLLVFGSQSDAAQVQSELNYVLNHTGVSLPMPLDTIAPVIYWYSNVGNTASGSYIEFNGATSGVPYDTSLGYTFSTTISLSQFGPTISIDTLISSLIESVSDNRDGNISINSSNVSLFGTMSVTQIVATGSYSMTFSITDLALNNIGSVNMNLLVI